MDKFKNKYRIPSSRLHGYDYSANGCYYVTICTKNREHYFGKIVQSHDNETRTPVETRLIASLRTASSLQTASPLQPPSSPQSHYLQPSPMGEIAKQYWLDIPNHFPFVILDEFVIMPNHIHGILFINKNDEIQCDDTHRRDAIRRDAINRVSTNRVSTNPITPPDTHKIGGITGIHNPMLHKNLGRVLRWFKGRVTFEYHPFGNFEWQERFHDRIIRDNDGLANVRNYIFDNPANWNEDELNDKNYTI